MINYDSRGGISIETRKGETTTSHLLIQNADETNSGKYSCSPSNAIVASIRVHVLNGKWRKQFSKPLNANVCEIFSFKTIMRLTLFKLL